MAYDYSKLRHLLEDQERFPLQFTHKFIGKNSPEFIASVALFEKRFPKLTRQLERQSGAGGHLALTYVLLADGPDEVIELLQATEQIQEFALASLGYCDLSLRMDLAKVFHQPIERQFVYMVVNNFADSRLVGSDQKGQITLRDLLSKAVVHKLAAKLKLCLV
jgi:hypothetical protein